MKRFNNETWILMLTSRSGYKPDNINWKHIKRIVQRIESGFS